MPSSFQLTKDFQTILTNNTRALGGEGYEDDSDMMVTVMTKMIMIMKMLLIMLAVMVMETMAKTIMVTIVTME